MKFKYLITVLRTVKIPGLFPIMRDWQAFVRMHFIYAALESGLLEALSTPSSRDDLIEKLNVKRPEILEALLDVGLSVKELACKNGTYSIKGKRSKSVMGNEGDILAAMIQANITYYSSAYRNAAERMHGDPLGNDLEKMGNLVARFAKIGEPLIRDFMTTIVTGKSSMRVLDVGCGSGVFMRSIYNANQNASGIGIDIDEEVVDQAKQNMEKWGLSNKFRIIAGDILDPPEGLEGPFDLITLFNIIYYFPSQERFELLKTLRSMLSPNGVVAVAMHFQSRGKDLGAANLNMVNCSLKGLTPLPDLDELTAQLKETGFNEIRIQRLMPRSTFFGIIASIP
ncbi:MAG: methyltransferase domain-containing protein [Desulfobacterales bacterium]|nr:methyltransferase domain-containing protein [Desulfobacterales bacterium]